MLTEDDFKPIPSVTGAWYAPDGRIVYTEERNLLIAQSDPRSKFRKLLDRLRS